MVEKGDSKFPKRTPPGKSPNLTAENPGMKSSFSSSLHKRNKFTSHLTLVDVLLIEDGQLHGNVRLGVLLT